MILDLYLFAYSAALFAYSKLKPVAAARPETLNMFADRAIRRSERLSPHDLQNVMDDAVNIMVVKNNFPPLLKDMISRDIISQVYPADTFNQNTFHLISKTYAVESVKCITNNELPLELVQDIVSYIL